ncbi:MAG: hypothetical protein HC848_08985 [Limnobacter sp.]|nr:hypothetical protein [Limnobacter sp.]
MVHVVALAYRDPRIVWAMALGTVLVHVLVHALAQSGVPAYMYETGKDTPLQVALHLLYTVALTAPLSLISLFLRKEALQAHESDALLARFNGLNGADFTQRAQPNAQGELSRLGQVFNDYADNMTFLVSSLHLLHTDMAGLGQASDALVQNQETHKNQGSEAAESLKTFVRQLGTQNRQAMATAEGCQILTEHCTDIKNKLFAGVQELNRISRLAFESNRQVQLLVANRHQLRRDDQDLSVTELAAKLDQLAEDVHNFSSEMDLIRSGFSAVGSEVQKLHLTTRQWVEDGTNNQRQSWEALSTLEQLQQQSDTTFGQLSELIATIVRSRDVLADMERRLAGFKL